jgi:hypothetical protein
MKVFIPISDEELDTWPAGDRLVPYRPGMSLLNQVAPVDCARETGLSRGEAPARRRDERPAPRPCPR